MSDAQLGPLFEPVLTEHQLELEGLEVKKVGRRRIVKVTVDGDGPKGRGPLVDDLAKAARALNRLVDERDPSGTSDYTIEVSSRGISRPLERPQHWRRNRTRLVTVTLAGEPAEEVTGRIGAGDDTGVLLDVAGVERRIEFADVDRAVVQIEWNRPAGLDEDDTDDIDDDDDTEDEEA